MRQHPRRSRGRGNNNNNNRRQSNNRHQVYDSNGPDGKIRGSAQQVYEKYMAAARDAASSGDRIAAESFYQHAEHYYRIHAAANEDSGNKQDGDNNRRGNRNRQDRDQNDEAVAIDSNDKPEETIIEDGSDTEANDAADSDDNDNEETGRGRGRGRGRSTRGNSRRRKDDDKADNNSDDAVAAESDGGDTEAEAKPARRRGRPPKAASAVAQLMSEVEGNVKEPEEA